MKLHLRSTNAKRAIFASGHSRRVVGVTGVRIREFPLFRSAARYQRSILTVLLHVKEHLHRDALRVSVQSADLDPVLLERAQIREVRADDRRAHSLDDRPPRVGVLGTAEYQFVLRAAAVPRLLPTDPGRRRVVDLHGDVHRFCEREMEAVNDNDVKSVTRTSGYEIAQMDR